MNQGSKVILFDIDRTLLDTDEFVNRLNRLVKRVSGLTYQQIRSKLDKYIETLPNVYYFSFVDFVNFLHLPSKHSIDIVREYKTNRSLYPKYGDVLPTLSKLKQLEYRVGIFSEGRPDFQKTKLANLDIDDFIDNGLVFIGQNKRTSDFLSQVPASSYIVDDNFQVVKLLAQINRFRPVFLDRQEPKSRWVSQLPPDRIHVADGDYIIIKSLTELIQLIDNT